MGEANDGIPPDLLTQGVGNSCHDLLVSLVNSVKVQSVQIQHHIHLFVFQKLRNALKGLQGIGKLHQEEPDLKLRVVQSAERSMTALAKLLKTASCAGNAVSMAQRWVQDNRRLVSERQQLPRLQAAGVAAMTTRCLTAVLTASLSSRPGVSMTDISKPAAVR